MARRRSSGEGSIYKTTRTKTRTDGTTYDVVSYRGYVTISTAGGKQQRKYVSAPTKVAANRKVRELQNQRDAGSLTTTTSPTVQTWIDYYLTVLAPKKPIKGRQGNRRSTIAAYKGYAKNHIYPTLGGKKLEDLTAEDLERAYQAMADAGMADSSIHQCHVMVTVALEVAFKRDRVRRNIAKLVMRPGGKQPDPLREVTVEEMKAVLVRANERRMPARWVVRLAYGLRQGECLGLSWADVDFDDALIYIRQQLQRDPAEHGCGEPDGTYRTPGRSKHGCGEPVGEATVRANPNRLKEPGELVRPVSLYPCGQRQVSKCPQARTEGGVERPKYPCGKAQPARCPQANGGGLMLVPLKTKASAAPLPLPKPIAVLLKARKAEQNRERIREGAKWKGWEVDGRQADLVFTQPNGRPLGSHDDWEEWYELLAEAGVEGIKPHAARHWAASMLVALEVNPAVVMQMLRHADVAMTLGLYAHATSPDLREAAERMAKLLFGDAVGE